MSVIEQTKTKPLSFVQAICEALDEAMAADTRVVLLGEDVGDREGGGVFKATAGLSTKYGDRVRSTPISEQAIVGAAIGAAIVGMRPVAEIMIMNFIPVALDQIYNHAAKLRYMSGGQTGVPLTIRTSNIGVGPGAQHADILEAWLAHAPGLKIAIPSNPADAKGLLLSCIFDDDPCVFIENPAIGPPMPVPAPGEPIPLGMASVRRTGDDVTVIAYGTAVAHSEAVAGKLADEGISVELVDLRTLVPLDEATILASVAKTHRAVVVHEAVKPFGVGAEISSRIHEEAFGDLEAPVQRVGAKYLPVPFTPNLAAAYQYSRDDVESAIRATLV